MLHDDAGAVQEVRNFLSFRTMLAVPFISIMFYGAVLLNLIGSIVLYGIRADAVGGRAVFEAILTFVAVTAMMRIFSECLIVIFKINEALQSIQSTLNCIQRMPVPTDFDQLTMQEPLPKQTTEMKIYR